MTDTTRYRPPLSLDLERKVRAGLHANRLTQAMLARRVGVTEKHVSRVLTGRDDGSIPFWDALLREAWRAPDENDFGNRPRRPGCVARGCDYSAAEGSGYCSLHGLKWGRDAEVVTPSRTDRQPPDSSSVTKGGLSAVGPEATKHPDLVTHHEDERTP